MKLRIFLDDLRASLWYRPALWIVGMGLLALALIAVDQRVSQLQLYQLLPWLFIEGAEGARTMLGAIGSAMLTVATLAFSIIMLAVVQTANAYSPRILRAYLSDTVNQHVLGVLIGTFLYSLLVLRVVRSSEETLFVPTLSITVGIGFALLSIAVFIYFIHHVAHSIEVGAVVTALQKETMSVLATLPRGMRGGAALGEGAVKEVVLANNTGYIEAVAVEPLVEAARLAGGQLRLERAVGDHVLAGTPLATVWAETEAGRVRLAVAVQADVALGRERTMVQDVAYGIRQLNDMALRAISPAVNDPSTAVNVIDVLGSILAEMLRRPLPDPCFLDEAGVLRVVLQPPTFPAMVDLAFTQIRQYGAGDFACVLRLLETCGELGYLATGEAERAALWKHVEMVARAADRRLAEPWDRAAINERLQQAATRLGRDPRPLLLPGAAPTSPEATIPPNR